MKKFLTLIILAVAVITVTSCTKASCQTNEPSDVIESEINFTQKYDDEHPSTPYIWVDIDWYTEELTHHWKNVKILDCRKTGINRTLIITTRNTGQHIISGGSIHISNIREQYEP